MRLAPTCFALLLAFICLAAICLAATGDSDASRSDHANGSSYPPTTNTQTARSRFTLRKLFDFERFKRVFKKRYSIVEELARAKLFLARAFRSFVSAVSYKNRKASSYLAINHMSDWTPAEVRSIDLKPDALLLDALQNMGPKTGAERSQVSEDEPVPAVSLSEVESTLREMSESSGSDGAAMKLIVAELKELESTGRKRRDVGGLEGPKRDISMSDLAREPPSEAADVGERVASNNPLYEAPELTSFGVDDDIPRKPLPWRDANYIVDLPGRDFLKSAVQKATDLLSSNEEMGEESLPDQMFIDLRDECMFAPRSQGRCGSCYAFAAVAIYEWLYCKATGKKVALSEQYIIDCGQTNGLSGCNGGLLTKVPNFILAYGMELRANYPYRDRQDQCPYDATIPAKNRGYLRISISRLEGVKDFQFEEKLKTDPIVLALLVSDAFHEYGGGVHDGAGCDPNRGHAVVLVGSGREDNQEYWLFRNSYSPTYGEGGYYKMNKNASHCIRSQQGYIYSGLTGVDKEEGVNNDYGSRAVKRRYHDYLSTNIASADE